MTPKQKQQFNAMRAALLRIGRGYQTPDQIRRQAEAKVAVKGVKTA